MHTIAYVCKHVCARASVNNGKQIARADPAPNDAHVTAVIYITATGVVCVYVCPRGYNNIIAKETESRSSSSSCKPEILYYYCCYYIVATTHVSDRARRRRSYVIVLFYCRRSLYCLHGGGIRLFVCSNICSVRAGDEVRCNNNNNNIAREMTRVLNGGHTTTTKCTAVLVRLRKKIKRRKPNVVRGSCDR